MPTPLTAEEITSDILTDIAAASSALTDANPGSVISAIAASVAVEDEKIYANIVTETDQGIRSSLYTTLKVTTAPATEAYGFATFSLPSALTTTTPIPQGTVVSVSNLSLSYVTQADASIASGATSTSVTVLCETAGTVGNIPASALSQIVSPPSVTGVSGLTVTNNYAFTNGQNAETEAEKAARAQQELARLHRGDKEALEYGALQAVVTSTSSGNVIEQVISSQAVASTTVGEVTLYIYNGTAYGAATGAASAALVTQAQNEINGYIDASGVTHYGWLVPGQIVTVTAAAEIQVTVTATLTLESTYVLSQVEAGVNTALSRYFSTLGIGGAVSAAEISRAILSTQGVVDVVLTAPSATIAGVNGTMPLLGPVTLST